MLSPDLTEVGNQIPYIHIFSYRGLMAELVISGMNVLRQTVEGYLRDVAQIFRRGGRRPQTVQYGLTQLQYRVEVICLIAVLSSHIPRPTGPHHHPTLILALYSCWKISVASYPWLLLY